ncbi:hypothetical protein QTP70_002783, partial [Hemibagrus guttatus]
MAVVINPGLNRSGDSMADSIEPLFTHKAVDEGDNVTLSCKYKKSTASDYLH